MSSHFKAVHGAADAGLSRAVRTNFSPVQHFNVCDHSPMSRVVSADICCPPNGAGGPGLCSVVQEPSPIALESQHLQSLEQVCRHTVLTC